MGGLSGAEFSETVSENYKGMLKLVGNQCIDEIQIKRNSISMLNRETYKSSEYVSRL